MAERDERLATEVALLESMYPEQLQFDERAREVSYSSDGGGFTLRLPSGYLEDALPEVLSASAAKTDLREQLKLRIEGCERGEEIIDSIVLAFNELLDAMVLESEQTYFTNGPSLSTQSHAKATVIVWLHHLLNTNKRKQALSAPSEEVSGVTKPGYPGVLIYSGPAEAVHEHVNDLKQLNWQAFQVRLESDEEWRFSHGSGVKEVEAMKNVVAEVGEERKALFMEAMKMK